MQGYRIFGTTVGISSTTAYLRTLQASKILCRPTYARSKSRNAEAVIQTSTVSPLCRTIVSTIATSFLPLIQYFQIHPLPNRHFPQSSYLPKPLPL